MWTLYVTLPELSVEGFQANVTLVAVLAVVCRLVGAVGGVRSGAAKAGEVLKSITSTTRIVATTLAVRQKRMCLFMLCLLTDNKVDAAARQSNETYVTNAPLDWFRTPRTEK